MLPDALHSAVADDTISAAARLPVLPPATVASCSRTSGRAVAGRTAATPPAASAVCAGSVTSPTTASSAIMAGATASTAKNATPPASRPISSAEDRDTTRVTNAHQVSAREAG
jgi:hypothetical protein